MAKVAAPGTLPSNSLETVGGGLKVGPMIRRKTPSELRGEQLKRTNVVELVDESPALMLGRKGNISEAVNGLKKQELPKNPRYIDTRMDEVYPVRKCRFRMPSGKESSKENCLEEQPSSLKHLTLLSDLAAKKRQQLSFPEDSVASADISQDGMMPACQTIEKCSQSKFRSVTELSSGVDISSSLATVDMDKALKGLVAREPISGFPTDSSEKSGESSLSGNFCSEFHMPGPRAPLDFTLKTNMRLVSSCSVNWLHRSVMGSTYSGMLQCKSKSGSSKDINNSSGLGLTSEVLHSKALHSWVYPQSILPASFISVLTSSAAEGVEMDFLRKRQLAWGDSFRSLYYMLRKNVCNIFYVCTSHFVVMFTAGCGSENTKRLCNAYISQSTSSLRSLLKEHDVCFSMPLCRSKVEQVTTEDLVELSEIEKHNLGQTRRMSSLSDIDNSPQSLLAFSGNKIVHSLYDFLLNYRSSLSFLTAVDVPVLYSPVPFQNAAVSAPEVKCTELKKAEYIAASPKEFPRDGESMEGLISGLCHIIEIKDTYLPPWIVSRICAVIGAEGRHFEASFVTEHTSVGLNVALQAASQKSETEGPVGKDMQETSDAFGIPESIVTPQLCSGQLKSLKYCNGSYTVFLSPV